MSNTIEVNGTEYEVDDNPSLRTVRNVQSMQTNLLREYLDEKDLRDMDSLEDESAIVQNIIDKKGFDAFQEVMWKNSMLVPAQTISLACDEVFDPDTFDDMGSKDFSEARESAEEVLGGDANDFFESLGIGTFLTNQEMQQQAQAAQSGT